MTEQHEFFQATVKRQDNEIHLIQGDKTIRVSQPMADAFTSRINAVSKEIEREEITKVMKKLRNEINPKPLRSVENGNFGAD